MFSLSIFFFLAKSYCVYFLIFSSSSPFASLFKHAFVLYESYSVKLIFFRLQIKTLLGMYSCHNSTAIDWNSICFDLFVLSSFLFSYTHSKHESVIVALIRTGCTIRIRILYIIFKGTKIVNQPLEVDNCDFHFKRKIQFITYD